MDQLLQCLATLGQGKPGQSSQSRSYAGATSSALPSFQNKEFFILERSRRSFPQYSIVRYTSNSNDLVVKQFNPPPACATGEICSSNIFKHGNSIVLLHTFGKKNNWSTRPSSYDITTSKWTTLTCAPESRTKYAAAMLNDCIVIVGDDNQRVYGYSELVYDITTDSWQAFPCFPFQVNSAAACTLEGDVYVSGGRNTFNVLYSSESEMYVCSHGTTTWKRLAQMPVKVHNHSMVSVGPRIYVLGGQMGPTPNMEVFVYHPNSNQWTVVESTSLKGDAMSLLTPTVHHSVYSHQDVMCTISNCPNHPHGHCLMNLVDDRGTLKVKCLAHLDFIKPSAYNICLCF